MSKVKTLLLIPQPDPANLPILTQGRPSFVWYKDTLVVLNGDMPPVAAHFAPLKHERINGGISVDPADLPGAKL
jgi:hypothetical protein